jgi:type II secretory pathway pseudopilin PulG
VVIAIMAILASFLIPVLGGVSKTKKLNVATAELRQIELALDGFKAKYGAYPPSNTQTFPAGQTNVMYPQLYYELVGVTNDLANKRYVTVDGAMMNDVDVPTAFGVGGFVNCWKGAGDEITPAQNFLLSLSSKQIATVQANGIWITNLVTSVGGPDANYPPTSPSINPFRYLCPGVNNPNSYDLWVQLQISGTKYLVCNWNTAHLKNDAAP